ncbi:MAG: hypothetical protein HY092_02670 [Candidatus Kerfeldbacteria bacterium]|nr:hypothetical protein [Candidatus Kerfeldbacteria bacterium]
MMISGHLLLTTFLTITGLLLILALAQLYHAFRFSKPTHMTIVTSGIFIAGIVAILFSAVILFHGVHWSGTFEVQTPAIQFGPQ